MAASRFPSWLLAVIFCKVFLYGAIVSADDRILSDRSGQHLKKQLCVSTYCKGLFDRDLKVCYRLFCARDTLDHNEHDDCVLDNCGHHTGFLRKVCVYEKCGKSRKRSEPTDESDGDDSEEGSDRLMNQVWSGELAAPPGRSDGDLGDLFYGGPDPSALQSKSCITKCKERAVDGEDDFEACFLNKCKIVSGRSNVSKRWSTRMCMESHCKSANNKVQYFLCGKQHCHK